jgi:hypothetical protein
MGKTKDRIENWADYYDRSDILGELLEEPIHFSLDPETGDHQIPALPDIDPPLAIRENQELVERFQMGSHQKKLTI